ncbi:MAG: hypothetical protein WBL23_03075 [Salinisphaera sp.]|uniref:hypothetical protein n=1 Tax=Salinisphaera sp. TaxID=1914330 RepID=UPI003C7D11F3
MRLHLRPLSRNYVGTQLDGNLFKTCAPFWTLLETERLGRDYIVIARVPKRLYIRRKRRDR